MSFVCRSTSQLSYINRGHDFALLQILGVQVDNRVLGGCQCCRGTKQGLGLKRVKVNYSTVTTATPMQLSTVLGILPTVSGYCQPFQYSE